jgi:hypothetical protein
MSRSVCIGYFSKPEVDLEIGPSRDAAKAERLLKPPVMFKYSEPFVRSGVQVVPDMPAGGAAINLPNP